MGIDDFFGCDLLCVATVRSATNFLIYFEIGLEFFDGSSFFIVLALFGTKCEFNNRRRLVRAANGHQPFVLLFFLKKKKKKKKSNVFGKYFSKIYDAYPQFHLMEI